MALRRHKQVRITEKMRSVTACFSRREWVSPTIWRQCVAFATVISTVLCLGTVIMWPRSIWVADSFSSFRASLGRDGLRETWAEFTSAEGAFAVFVDRRIFVGVVPDGLGAAVARPARVCRVSGRSN